MSRSIGVDRTHLVIRLQAALTAAAAVLLALSWASDATAAPASQSAFALAVHAGHYDVGSGRAETEAGVELRAATAFLGLAHAGGVMVNSGGAAYAYYGLRRPIKLGRWLVVTPHTGTGVYESGASKDLGGPVEFRSGLELVVNMSDWAQLGINFYHLSNAVLYRENPGSNSLVMTWSFSGDPPNRQ
ncbi:MAG: acyloxyacyl hydrolase [Candidatus Schekmanbacteria bacterium]|nr:acyloxyacyl hydrolase [Candidatus Schekmanbacteria bacterium]